MISDIIFTLIIGVFTGIFGYTIGKHHAESTHQEYVYKYEEVVNDKNYYKRQYDIAYDNYIHYKKEAQRLCDIANSLKNNIRNNAVNTNNQIVKDAIKKAMICSHPDKGGSTEEFIKFRKLYEEVKNGK